MPYGNLNIILPSFYHCLIGPDLDSNWTKQNIMDMHEEVYDGPDLGKTRVNGDIATSSNEPLSAVIEASVSVYE